MFARMYPAFARYDLPGGIITKKNRLIYLITFLKKINNGNIF